MTEEYPEINVEKQTGKKNSILEFYKRYDLRFVSKRLTL